MRHYQDYYPTPRKFFEKLEPFINWLKVDSFFEPCHGDKRIVEWVGRRGGISVSSIDLNATDAKEKQDYLDFAYQPPKVNLVITNPPYSAALPFIHKTLPKANCSFFFLRLNFLAARSREQWFKANPLKALIVSSERPSFTDDGRTDATDYGWFVWEKEGSEICKVKGVIHL